MVPNELTVSWTRPLEININGVLTFYSLRYHRIGLDDFVFVAVDGSQESTSLRGLESYAVYEVFIAASTINGTGPFISHTAQTRETGELCATFRIDNFSNKDNLIYTIFCVL